MRLLTLSLLSTAFLLLLSGCQGVTPSPKNGTQTDTTLPVVTLTKNGIITDMNSLAFEFTSMPDARIKGIYVYKNEINPQDKAKQIEYYTTIENRFATHFVDNEIKPNTLYKYAFKTFAESGVSQTSQVIQVRSKPVLSSVSWIYSVTGLPRSAKILWRPHNDRRVESYIIERRTLKNDEWDKIAQLQGRLNAEYIDTDLEDNHVYMYRVRVHTFDDITSTPSEIVKVITKPLPKEIHSIQATRNLPRQIKVTWERSTSKDFALYHLYRSENIDGNYDLIAVLHNPVFIDKVKKDGAIYFYRVSEIDKDGLESVHDKISIQGMSLLKPLTPTLLKADLINNSYIELNWQSTDDRVSSFKIVKTQKKSLFDKKTQTIDGIHQNSFIDRDIQPNTTYTYSVHAVDSSGIVSEPSMEVEIQTPNIAQPQQSSKPTTQQQVQQVQQTPQNTPTESTEDVVISPTDDLDLNGL